MARESREQRLARGPVRLNRAPGGETDGGADAVEIRYRIRCRGPGLARVRSLARPASSSDSSMKPEEKRQ